MINILETKKNKVIFAIITAILIISMVTVSGNFNSSQRSNAQKTNSTSIGTFSAKGYTGQIFVLPNLILTPNQQRPPVGSVVGGNWSFAVNDGQVQKFQWIAQAYALTGKVNGTMSINGMKNTSNFDIAHPSSSDPIKLAGNSTAFKGNVNIDINGKTAWMDIPAIVTLSNGKLISLAISDEKTNGAFTVPLFGVVTSLTP